MGEVQKNLPCLEWGKGGGGVTISFGPLISHFVAPFPVINDRSLIDVTSKSV